MCCYIQTQYLCDLFYMSWVLVMIMMCKRPTPAALPHKNNFLCKCLTTWHDLTGTTAEQVKGFQWEHNCDSMALLHRMWSTCAPSRVQCCWLPVHVQLQVWKDELLLNEFPDDTSHLVSLHLHHGPRLDLLRHLGSWRGDRGGVFI